MNYQFKIKLKNTSKPPVWRRIKVNGKTSLHHFHEIIQAAFGWENYHLYQFSPKGWGSYPNYSIKEEGDDFDDIDEDSREHSIQDALAYLGSKLVYLYDFGDGWEHEIVVEKIEEDLLLKPVLLAGKGACPPEDCGGIWAYYQLVEEEELDPHDFELIDAIAYFQDFLNDLR